MRVIRNSHWRFRVRAVAGQGVSRLVTPAVLPNVLDAVLAPVGFTVTVMPRPGASRWDHRPKHRGKWVQACRLDSGREPVRAVRPRP